MTISKNPKKIQELFDVIAEKYDFNNNIISLGLHKTIKFLSLKNIEIKNGAKILDECTGTGDITGLIKKINLDVEITGIDFSRNMLAGAKNKFPSVTFIQTDCTNLPFDNETFDIITMTFGLRNIEDYNKALQETFRVLKSGGEFLHLDFGEKNFFSKIFDTLVPPLIKLFYGKNLPYAYLLESKKEFPTPDKLIEIFKSHGFKLKCRKDFLFGIISSQIMQKP